MSVLTREQMVNLDDATLKVLGKSPVYKAVAFDIIAERARELASESIAFSNQATFDIAGVEMPISLVALIAYSKLPVSEVKTYTNADGIEVVIPVTPELNSIQSEAWETLKRVKAGMSAQGKKFNVDSKGLRELIG